MGSTVAYITAADVPPALREAVYCHAILRKAGVAADDIFVAWADGGLSVLARRSLFVVLVAVYPVDFPDELTCREAWEGAVRLWNATADDPAAGWDLEGSDSRAHAVEILAALELAGATADRIVPPGRN